MRSVGLNEVEDGVGISGADLGSGTGGTGLQPEVADGVEGARGLDQLDEDKGRVSVERVAGQTKVLGSGGGSPASGVKLVGLDSPRYTHYPFLFFSFTFLSTVPVLWKRRRGVTDDI